MFLQIRRAFALLSVLLVPISLGNVSSVHAADHLDAPALQEANMGDKDINDLYAFQSPANAANSVLIMTVNPLAGVSPNPFFPNAASGTRFGTDVTYEFNIDNDGDNVADIVYATTFGAAIAGSQSFTTTRNGSPFATGVSGVNNPIGTGGTGGNITAGVFDDPFFFDLVAFNSLSFTDPGNDTFAGLNVSALVLEVPSTDLNGATSNIGVWARTLVGTDQIDRMGRPGINTVLLSTSSKDDFNEGDPTTDFTEFGTEVNAAIAGLSNQANADALTPILLPDVLTFDTSSAAGFLNGRRLEDDVIDAALGLLTAGAIPSDGVDENDRDFLDVFPYLASRNTVPEPTGIALALLGLSVLGCRRRRA